MSAALLRVDSPEEREAAIKAAVRAIGRGRLVVIPTDTVYGLAADAFEPDSVERLLTAKGRGREMPPPVLISSMTTVDALAVGLPEYARALIEEFWPGPLTIVARQQPSLQWDLGDTRGTVAIRMPDHDLAREIIERTGPLAVSSANITGQPPATTAEEAEEMLGDAVPVIVDAGPTPGLVPSTIVAVTGTRPKVLREGALSRERLDEVLTPLGWSVGEEAADLGDGPAGDSEEDSGNAGDGIDAAGDEAGQPPTAPVDPPADGDGDGRD